MNYLRPRNLIILAATGVSSVFMSCDNGKAKRELEQKKEKAELALIRAEIIANNELMDNILKVKVHKISRDNETNRWKISLHLTNLGKVPILAVRGNIELSTILDGAVCSWPIDYDDEIQVMATNKAGWALSPKETDVIFMRLGKCPSPDSIEPSKLTAEFQSCTIVLANNERLIRYNPDISSKSSRRGLCREH